MADGYLLDTNIVSAILDREARVLQRLREANFFLPSIVVGQLYAWAFYPQTRRERLEQVRTFLSVAPVLTPDTGTGERYGLLYADLTRRGVPMPVNDLWIAAIALQNDLVLVTRDSDFDRVTGLRVEHW